MSIIMKKLLFILMAFCLMAPVANADLNKKLDKAKEKAVNAKINNFLYMFIQNILWKSKFWNSMIHNATQMVMFFI